VAVYKRPHHKCNSAEPYCDTEVNLFHKRNEQKLINWIKLRSEIRQNVKGKSTVWLQGDT